jgi:hypothetical protein
MKLFHETGNYNFVKENVVFKLGPHTELHEAKVMQVLFRVTVNDLQFTISAFYDETTVSSFMKPI